MALIVVAICSFLFVGCALTDWLTPDMPVDPVSVMEADVDAVLVLDGGTDEVDAVAWSIENVGTSDISMYMITFDVSYPDVDKDNVTFTETGYELEVGEKHEELLDLVPYGDHSPETVSVSWELFD